MSVCTELMQTGSQSRHNARLLVSSHVPGFRHAHVATNLRRYQARLIELQQKGGLGMQQIQALATEELLEEYIRNKCAQDALAFALRLCRGSLNPIFRGI